MPIIYCMWRHPVTNQTHTLGTLGFKTEYSFAYHNPPLAQEWMKDGLLYPDHGCKTTDCGHPLVDPFRIYTSPNLFFWFSRQLMHPKRPDWPDYVRCMDLDPKTATDLDILSRTPTHPSIYTSRHLAFRSPYKSQSAFFLDISVEEMNLAIGDKFTVDSSFRVWDTCDQLVGRIPWHWQDQFTGGEVLSVVKRNELGPLNMRLLCKLG